MSRVSCFVLKKTVISIHQHKNSVLKKKKKGVRKPAPHDGRQMYYDVSRVLPFSIFPFFFFGRDAVNWTLSA
jgi:hypothetical protein